MSFSFRFFVVSIIFVSIGFSGYGMGDDLKPDECPSCRKLGREKTFRHIRPVLNNENWGVFYGGKASYTNEEINKIIKQSQEDAKKVICGEFAVYKRGPRTVISGWKDVKYSYYTEKVPIISLYPPRYLLEKNIAHKCCCSNCIKKLNFSWRVSFIDD